MIYDVAIIGGGPVGIFSIFANGMQSLSCVVVDALDQLGGQCRCVYPEKYIYDIPGFMRITGGDLINNLERQAIVFNPEIKLNSVVKNVSKKDGFFELFIENAQNSNEVSTISAKSILIALGSGIFKPMKPALENLEAYENKNVFYFLNDLSQFQDKVVVIAGGGDSAVDWALMLSEIAKKVYLVHRREFIKAHPSSWQKVLEISSKEDAKIEIKIPYQITQILEQEQLSKDYAACENAEPIKENVFVGLKLLDANGNEEDIKCDYFLPCFGLKSDLNFLNDWEVSLSNNRIFVDSTTMRTSCEGVYAIGDCVDYPNKRKLIVTGFAEAMQAAVDIYAYVHPDKAPIIGHSTSIGLPGME